MKTTTLKAMILWAKDRLFDDLEAVVEDFQKSTNFAHSDDQRRKDIQAKIAKLSALFNLPDDSYAALADLREAGYWNGANDTYWESHAPPIGYKGQ